MKTLPSPDGLGAGVLLGQGGDGLRRGRRQDRLEDLHNPWPDRRDRRAHQGEDRRRISRHATTGTCGRSNWRARAKVLLGQMAAAETNAPAQEGVADRADRAGGRRDAPREDAEEGQVRAVDPDVHPRDEQVPGRLARPPLRGADRRDARRVAPADQRPRGEAHRDEPGERQGSAARESGDRARVRVVALVEQEARGQARHLEPGERGRQGHNQAEARAHPRPGSPDYRHGSPRCGRRSSATA